MSLASNIAVNTRILTAHVAAGAAAVEPLQVEIIAPDAWDRRASAFDGICQEQLCAYAQARWPGVVLEPLIFSRDGQTVGGALVMIQPLPLGLASIALTKWGPILADNADSGADRLMGQMVDHITQAYAKERGMMVTIMAKTAPGDTNADFQRLMAKGYVKGQGVRFPNRYVVDVRLDDETRMARFGQKWRYHLRKSFKAGLSFERAGPEQLDRFMVLYNAMSDRKQFPDYSAIDSLDSFLAMPGGTARPELFFVTHEGETVAGAVIFTAGHTAAYLYGATNDDALDLRAGYFLHWHIIRWLRDNTEAKVYDLGGTDGFQGLHQFKSGMVGEGGYIAPIPPMANYAISLRARFWGALAYEARAFATKTRDGMEHLKRKIMRKLRRA
ncbi:lipid II:glycine glycyltransferase FemX [Pelagibacterium lentulum]|uniref:BioF2-like acetyltransferase domain-containing protein n=1 Tax=Pelagibacterium lentulum TaxID=2029865 RepID=A0A916RB46_9HYPH|nr:GNAT family N-acetyltransferase [Pelagibacterium lentulum]GGA47368.1 hypothetical protein GCM10011499_16460 [Pelagibacterium lentulum]